MAQGLTTYVMNFESLLLKEFPSNDVTEPLMTIISAAIFSVNSVDGFTFFAENRTMDAMNRKGGTL